MNAFEVNGTKVHYQTEGAGAPLVFVHGSAGGAKQWKRLYEHFAKTRQVFAYDLIGCGMNEPVSVLDFGYDQYTAEAYRSVFENDARVLSAVLDRMEQPVDVIAHSAGGVGAILTAIERPTAIRTLTLFEPVVFHLLRDSLDPAFEPVRLIALAYRTLFAHHGSQAAMEEFVDFWNGRGSWRRLPDAIQRFMLIGAGRLYHDWGTVLYGRSLLRASDLARLSQPVLYFWGERTIEPMKRLSDIVRTGLPNCRAFPVVGANHMAPFTHAEHVLNEIEAHVEIMPPQTRAAVTHR